MSAIPERRDAAGWYLVVGGRQRRDAFGREPWQHWDRGRVLLVDADTGRGCLLFDYVSPRELVADEERSTVFRAATLADERLLLCTGTEVLVAALPSCAILGRFSHPWFNDLHHVTWSANGRWLVASTGLDAVIELEPEGEIVRCWDAETGDAGPRRPAAVDYRRIGSTKPHVVHPNYVFEAAGELWVTRFEQRDAFGLGSRRQLVVGGERPHDGVVVEDRDIWFTTVDGHVVAVSPEDPTRRTVYDLRAMAATDRELGWCRGLCLPAAGQVVVGLSRLRPTRWRENVRWVKHRLGRRATPGTLPTRIAAFDLTAGRLQWELDLEPWGLNVVFSVHPAPVCLLGAVPTGPPPEGPAGR